MDVQSFVSGLSEVRHSFDRVSYKGKDGSEYYPLLNYKREIASLVAVRVGEEKEEVVDCMQKLGVHAEYNMIMDSSCYDDVIVCDSIIVANSLNIELLSRGIEHPIVTIINFDANYKNYLSIRDTKFHIVSKNISKQILDFAWEVNQESVDKNKGKFIYLYDISKCNIKNFVDCYIELRDKKQPEHGIPKVPNALIGEKSIKTTPETVEAVMEWCGVYIKWDEITYKTKIIYTKPYQHLIYRINTPPSYFDWIDYSDTRDGNIIRSFCLAKCMQKDGIENMVEAISRKYTYNSWREFLDEKPYQEVKGYSYIDDVFNCLKIDPEYKQYRDLIKSMFVKWCISVVMLDDLKSYTGKDGIAAQGVIILKGPQGIKKTTFFKNLFPEELFKEGRYLNPDDKDTMLDAVQSLCVELGEFEATTKHDANRLKSYITSDTDYIRRPYGRSPETMPRKTVFCATVNSEHFLKDDTGNRRFWTIPVTACTFDDSVFGKQRLDFIRAFWQEVREIAKKNETRIYWLTKEEDLLLSEINARHLPAEPVEELVATLFDWQSDPRMWDWKTSTDVARMILKKDPNKSDVTKAGLALRKCAGENYRIRFFGCGKVKQALVPLLRT